MKPQPEVRELANVTLHIGDSHSLLPETLAEFAERGRNVDFVLVDGDHLTDGVRRDMEDLLNSEATAQTLIVMHDTMNPVVREGLEAVTFDVWPKVEYVELDFVAGQVFRQPSLFGELWGGLGLVVTGSGPRRHGATARQTRYFDTYRIVTDGREAVLGRAGREDLRAKPPPRTPTPRATTRSTISSRNATGCSPNWRTCRAVLPPDGGLGADRQLGELEDDSAAARRQANSGELGIEGRAPRLFGPVRLLDEPRADPARDLA